MFGLSEIFEEILGEKVLSHIQADADISKIGTVFFENTFFILFESLIIIEYG